MSYYMAGGALDDFLKAGGFVENPSPSGYPAAVPAGKKTKSSSSNVFSITGRRKHRHMHVTNVKALRRAMRRVQGFAHLAKSTLVFTQHHKMKKRGRRRC